MSWGQSKGWWLGKEEDWDKQEKANEKRVLFLTQSLCTSASDLQRKFERQENVMKSEWWV